MNLISCFKNIPCVHAFLLSLKSISVIESVPGHSIVAGNGSLKEPTSIYSDGHIKSLVFQLPSFGKDTTDLFNKLEEIKNFDKKDFICTLNVTSLYTNVPHREGLVALRYFLLKRETHLPPTDFQLEMLELILNRNSFKFEDTYYLQHQGMAMGSSCNPNYANLLMGKFEEDFFV